MTDQLSFADVEALGESFADASLFETTLVVVDLETTGSSPTADRITEIGAVKVRGGEVLGEFATLVDPGVPIPPQIVTLTGITEAMVTDAPTIGEVLGSFIEFARGSILVAHNARFDMGFLRRNAERLHMSWPFTTSLCTVTMARRVLDRDEAPSVKLSALADLFDVTVRPTHRALDDARATVEVLHHLIERVGNQGVTTYRELTAFLPRTDPAVRAKRHLADAVPSRPGVYLFRGPSEEVLYVGTAVDLRRRVLSYFNGSDPRRRMTEMVRLATRIDHVECSHALEAGVRELRLLAAHAPAYNRRSTRPHRGWWIVLTSERFPRLKVSRTPSGEAVGPVSSRTEAAAVADLIAATAGLRTCTARLGSASHHWCPSDTVDGRIVGGCHAGSTRPLTPTEYASRVAATRALIVGESASLLDAATSRLSELADAEMFETAARHRDRIASCVEVLARSQRLQALCAVEQLVVARPGEHRSWEISIVRHGRLAAAGRVGSGVAPMPVIDALTASAQTVLPDDGPLRGASAYEAALLYSAVTEPGTRIVSTTTGLSLPRHGATGHAEWSKAARRARGLMELGCDP